jgi:glycosyltransferase involved in cell wall biosynthesis
VDRTATAGVITGRRVTRILVVTQYFPPEIGAPQARLSEMARSWAAAGAEVTVLTGMPNHPTGVVPERYRRRLRVVEAVDGYRVVRTWLYATPNERVIRKTLSHASFMISSVLLGLPGLGKTDVVVVSSPTFLSLFSGWVAAPTKRAAFVIEIRDLWPAIFVELGVLRNARLIAAIERVELALYGAADMVVVVTEAFREDLIRRGVPAAKVHTIRNGADVERFVPSPASKAVRETLGASEADVLVLYLGAHGLSHGLVALADAAAKMVGEPVRFAFVGEGAAKEGLVRRVEELGLANVTIRPGVPRDEVPSVLAAADICLVPLRDVPLFSSFIPSKMFEFLAAGKAVVGALRGEAAEILRAAGALVVAPEDPAALADAIRELAADPDRRAAMGVAGRAYITEHFDRARLAERYLALLVSIGRP